jgi:hypothetical protein
MSAPFQSNFLSSFIAENPPGGVATVGVQAGFASSAALVGAGLVSGSADPPMAAPTKDKCAEIFAKFGADVARENIVFGCVRDSSMMVNLLDKDAIMREPDARSVDLVLNFARKSLQFVLRKDVMKDHCILVFGDTIENSSLTPFELSVGTVGTVGVKVTDVSGGENAIINGVCLGATRANIGAFWRHMEPVVLSSVARFFLVALNPNDFFSHAIGNLSSSNVKDPPSTALPEAKRRKAGLEGNGEGIDWESENYSRRLLNGWLIPCCDGVARTVTTKAGAYERIIVVQGLLRIWPPSTISIYLRDMTLDMDKLAKAANFGQFTGINLPDEARSDELNIFGGLQPISHLAVIKDVKMLKLLVLGAWDLLSADRLRLMDFTSIKETDRCWAIEPTGVRSKTLFYEALRNLKLCIDAVWGEDFSAAFNPFLAMQFARIDLAKHYCAAYLASRVEEAMHFFHVNVFINKGHNDGLCRSSAGCVSILCSCLKLACDTTIWEAYPCYLFFADDGHYERYAEKKKVVKKIKSPAPSKSTTPSRTPNSKSPSKGGPVVSKAPCLYRVSTWMSVVDAAGAPFDLCKRKPCQFSHDAASLWALKRADAITLLDAHLKGKKAALYGLPAAKAAIEAGGGLFTA